MQAASLPIQRPKDARLLVIDRCGRIHHRLRSAIVDLVHAGDCVIANDAATLPASLHGIHEPTGVSIEVRLASRASLDAHDVRRFSAASCLVPGTFVLRRKHVKRPRVSLQGTDCDSVRCRQRSYGRSIIRASSSLISMGVRRASGKDLPHTADQFSTLMFHSRSDCGMCGLRSLRSPWRSSRLRRALCSIGTQ